MATEIIDMQSLHELANRLDKLTDLQGIVKTMQTLAAVNIHQLEQATLSISAYQRTIEQGLGLLLRHRPEILKTSKSSKRVEGRIFIICGSDTGLCGQFNHALVDKTVQQISQSAQESKRQPIKILAIGSQIQQLLTSTSIEVSDYLISPSSLDSLRHTVNEILLWLGNIQKKDIDDNIYVIYNLHLSTVHYRSECLQLLPLTLEVKKRLSQVSWDSQSLPLYTSQWQPLFSATIREYIFVHLYRCCAESLASEHISRLIAMGQASDNIEKRLEEMQNNFRRQRQASITTELLDVITGYHSVTEKHSKSL